MTDSKQWKERFEALIRDNGTESDLNRVVFERFGDAANPTTMVHAIHDEQYSMVLGGPFVQTVHGPDRLCLELTELHTRLVAEACTDIFALYEAQELRDAPFTTKVVAFTADGSTTDRLF